MTSMPSDDPPQRGFTMSGVKTEVRNRSSIDPVGWACLQTAIVRLRRLLAARGQAAFDCLQAWRRLRSAELTERRHPEHAADLVGHEADRHGPPAIGQHGDVIEFLDSAVHAQPVGAVTVSEPDPPAADTAWLVAESV